MLSLRPIELLADPASYDDEHLRGFVEMTVAHYKRIGFKQPWVGYLALNDCGTPVGICGFKSPPSDKRVEIAYATLPGKEGRGVATSMAQKLIELAQQYDPDISIFAQTLPEKSASTSILQKLGFIHSATLEHDEDGTIWEWELAAVSPA